MHLSVIKPCTLTRTLKTMRSLAAPARRTTFQRVAAVDFSMDWIRGFRVRLFHLYVFEEPGAGKWDRWFRLVGLRLCSLVFSVWVLRVWGYSAV